MTVTKKTRLLGAVPIVRSSDGQVKVTSVSNDAHTEYLTYGEKWTMRGSGLTNRIEEGVRWIPDVAVECPGDETESPHFLQLTAAADGKSMEMTPHPYYPPPSSGTYKDAKLSMMTYKDDEQEILDMPIKLIVP